MDATRPLRLLTVPVNSAAHWAHLYVEAGGDAGAEGGAVVDLTSTSRLDLWRTVPITDPAPGLARPAPIE